MDYCIFLDHFCAAWLRKKEKTNLAQQVQKGPQCRSHDLDPQGEAARGSQGKRWEIVFCWLLMVHLNFDGFFHYDIEIWWIFHDVVHCQKELDFFGNHWTNPPWVCGASDDGGNVSTCSESCRRLGGKSIWTCSKWNESNF